MPLEKITSVSGRAVHVPGDDIDTDRIIPARFMKCVTFDGLGEFLFYDVRYDENNRERKHPLNDPKFTGAKILISGNNFGCGSSREHAPQAIYRYGFRAVIAEGFAEIFFGNSTTLGMPCVVVTHEDRLKLGKAIEADPSLEVKIDLESMKVTFGSDSIPCTQRDTARKGLLDGKWDAIGDLLDGIPDVEKVAKSLPYMAAS